MELGGSSSGTPLYPFGTAGKYDINIRIYIYISMYVSMYLCIYIYIYVPSPSHHVRGAIRGSPVPHSAKECHEAWKVPCLKDTVLALK